MEGYNCTVFAYGQTGCGKSFSMQGVDSPSSQRGIIPRAFEHVFEAISVTDDVKFLVLASYIEIYNEEVRDLLSMDTKRRLELKESPERGVYVHGIRAPKLFILTNNILCFTYINVKNIKKLIIIKTIQIYIYKYSISIHTGRFILMVCFFEKY